ncbi:nuclear transport factor 2 family protein [Leifsonia shinshuensis]|uniref:Nuclear transport factor 2 family protein n=1 Tax=Leifsonia shinshuensis TaxID=150026 RepID=A0A7G6YF95_9MICO|nr:nuclear transport factor 2 family protein [Leifsonia shinshuensis]QNE37160.1 nuclear transport factor 2 family protein [Leifsonia shinshuensis]
MSSIQDLLDANLHRVFGERDAAARRAAIDKVYTEDVVFTDPDGTASGRDALAAKADELLGGLPADFAFSEDGPRYEGAGRGALAWALGPAGAPVARGVDIIVVRDGRISELQTLLVPTA